MPATGLDGTQLYDLRGAMQSYLPYAPVRTIERGWQISPSIGVDVGLTDNAYRVSSPRRADVFTLITPAILVSGQTAHIQANASYNPAISIYANNSSQTRVDQFGQAGALITFVPDTLFLDLRGSVQESSATGGFGTANQRGFNRNNQVTSVALSATPYVEHRFGGWGTGRLSYSIAQTFEDTPYNQDGFVVPPAGVSSALGANQAFYGSSGNLTTQRERASFASGENFGRINDIIVLEAVQYDGRGSYRGAYRNEATNTTGYAVTRAFTALGSVGYQELRYGGVPGLRLSEPIWSVGGRYAPNPNLSLTLTYGHRDGINDFGVDGMYAPTARTVIYVRYSTGLTSDAEEQQNVLTATNVGANGLLVDRITGAPVSSGSGFFGTQNNLYELKRFSVTGLLSLNRDSFSASIVHEDRTAINAAYSNAGNAIIPAGTSTSGTFGTLSWGHQLSDRLSSNVNFAYGVNDNGNALGFGSGSQTSITASAGLAYVFTPTLTGRVIYSYTNVSGSNGYNNLGFNNFGYTSGNYTENALLVGIRKSF